MNLKCRINELTYDCNMVQGVPFTEEYTEILDSAAIIIAHIDQIKILSPFDDVYLYDADFEFNGFNEKGYVKDKQENLVDYYGYLIDNNGDFILENGEKVLKCRFYKHFLIDSFEEQKLRVENKTKYNYTIQLFSELKGLEIIQLPNISITQPLNIDKKISIYEYLNRFIDMYSPKIKVAVDDNSWEYKNKYKLSSDFVDIIFEKDEKGTKMKTEFSKGYTPDFSLNSPNLKDVITQLMIVNDRIPYVYNNIIYALDITERRKKPFDETKGDIGYITGSRTSQNHCDNLKRTYVNALGQSNSCRMVEYLGFRNSNVSLMKINDLRIETKFPIYKINKVLMCYYKKGTVYGSSDNQKRRDVAFLCKQDITPLVKLNSERNLLSQDWDTFNDDKPKTMKELSQYKLCTVGYDIGSNYITGWGEKYTYPIGWWDREKTYVENILLTINSIHPYGIYDIGYLANNYLEHDEYIKFPKIQETIKQILASPYTNNSLALKSLFFVVEYDGFYNGTTITTKDEARNDITINDNPSSSLTLLEKDGLSQKEKINRFGNKALIINARYKKMEDLQPLGSVIGDDIIIYHREYSIYDNYILCTYYGMKDYVLKNFYTSVYAKHRPYNLMSYGESITRSENKKISLLLSKEKLFFEKDKKISFSKFYDNKFLTQTFSAFIPSQEMESIDNYKNDNKINYSYLRLNSPIYDESGNITGYKEQNFVSDLNVFVTGNSLCFNTRMYDNVSAGVYIKELEPFADEKYKGDWEKQDWASWIMATDSVYSGSKQAWYMTVDDIETGALKKIGVYFAHIDQEKEYLTKVFDYEDDDSLRKDLYEMYTQKLSPMPLISEDNKNKTNIIGDTFEINKDNKEIIDITYQLEPITEDKDIFFGPWMMKLSELYGNKSKFFENTSIVDVTYETGIFKLLTTSGEFSPVTSRSFVPIIMFSISKDYIKNIKKGFKIDIGFSVPSFGKEEWKEEYADSNIVNYAFVPEEIVEDITYDQYGMPSRMTVKGTQYVSEKNYSTGEINRYEDEVVMKFGNFLESYQGKQKWTPLNEDRYYMCNCYLGGVGLIDNFSYYTFHSDTSLRELEIYYDNGTKYFSTIATSNGYIWKPYDEDYLENPTRQEMFINGTNCSEEPIDFIIPETNEVFTGDIEKTYKKNMFIVLSDEKIKKNIIYTEFKNGELNNIIDEEVPKIFKITEEIDKGSYISIDVQKLKQHKAKFNSIQYWYLDEESNAYKFVFGVNVNEEEIKKDEIKIYISVLSSMNNVVYDKNYNLIGETTNYCGINKEEKTEENIYISSSFDEEKGKFKFVLDKNNLLDVLEKNAFFETKQNIKSIIRVVTTYPPFENENGILETPAPKIENIYSEYHSLDYNKQTKKLTLKSSAGTRYDLIFQKEEEELVAFLEDDFGKTLDLKNTKKIESITFNPNYYKVIYSEKPIYGLKQYYTKY